MKSSTVMGAEWLRALREQERAGARRAGRAGWWMCTLMGLLACVPLAGLATWLLVVPVGVIVLVLVVVTAVKGCPVRALVLLLWLLLMSAWCAVAPMFTVKLWRWWQDHEMVIEWR